MTGPQLENQDPAPGEQGLGQNWLIAAKAADRAERRRREEAWNHILPPGLLGRPATLMFSLDQLAFLQWEDRETLRILSKDVTQTPLAPDGREWRWVDSRLRLVHKDDNTDSMQEAVVEMGEALLPKNSH